MSHKNKIKPGDHVTPSAELNLRTHPTTENNTPIATLRREIELTIVRGPESADKHQWWYVRAQGWAADHRMTGDVRRGGFAVVEDTQNDPGLHLRTVPGDHGDIVAEMAPYTRLEILHHEPERASVGSTTYTWWNVRIEGWVAEEYLNKL